MFTIYKVLSKINIEIMAPYNVFLHRHSVEFPWRDAMKIRYIYGQNEFKVMHRVIIFLINVMY